jgi:hypothetical protein
LTGTMTAVPPSEFHQRTIASVVAADRPDPLALEVGEALQLGLRANENAAAVDEGSAG